MGINLQNADWWPIVSKHQQAHPCPCKLPQNKGKFCAFHGWMYSDPTRVKQNIHTTPQAEEFIRAHCLKRDENGKLIPSTERGKRKKEKKAG